MLFFIGKAIERIGSKAVEIFLQVRHVTVDFSCPYIKSTIML